MRGRDVSGDSVKSVDSATRSSRVVCVDSTRREVRYMCASCELSLGSTASFILGALVLVFGGVPEWCEGTALRTIG